MAVNESPRKYVVDLLYVTSGPCGGPRSAFSASPSRPTPMTCGTPPPSTSLPLDRPRGVRRRPRTMVTVVRELPDMDMMPNAEGGRGRRRIVLATDWPQFLSLSLSELRATIRGAPGAGSSPRRDPRTSPLHSPVRRAPLET